jgi:hypothetical protein
MSELTNGPIGQLIGALAAAQLEFGSLTKTHENTYTGKKYADLADVIAATQPALAKNGLSVVQIPIRKDGEKEAGVRTILAHSSGESISVELMLPATMKASGGELKFDQQSIGSAITYARRYTWQALVGVAAEEDDDGNAATDRSADTAKTPEKPKPAKTPLISQKVASQGGERPNDSKLPSVKITNVPALSSEPVVIEQSAPQTNDPAPVESSVVPKAVIPADTQAVQLPLTPVESTISAASEPDKKPDLLEKLKSSEKPVKSQLDTYVNKATALRLVLEKNGFKASKNLTAGAKLKNYLLAFSGAKELTDLAIYQWEDFFIHADSTEPVQLVNLIEGGK